MDIVEWLRDYYHMDSRRYSNVQIADEIERLREQERKMTNHALERMEEIERLREENTALQQSADDVYKRLMPEVERLREALHTIAATKNVDSTADAKMMWIGCTQIARSALQQKEVE